MRILSITLSVIGFFLIFTPIIVLLKWIPLIGVFLGGAAMIAAFLIALIVGLTLSISNIALAWLLFRPFLAISLLSIVGLGVYFLFF